MSTKKKRNAGDIVKIAISQDKHSYARALNGAMFAFYDYFGEINLNISNIVDRPILFQLSVMHHAVKSGRWQVVGHAPLEASLLSAPPRFIQDSLDPKKFSILEGGVIRPATRIECEGLEPAAVWEPTHVEDRLRDHYAGQENKWVKSLRIKD